MKPLSCCHLPAIWPRGEWPKSSHQEFGQFPLVIGLLLEGVGIAEAFALKINRVNLMPPEAQIPVIAENALKDLFFEKIERGVIKLDWRENAVRIEPCLKAGINAIEVKE
jgi:hypothetical protein